MTCRALAWSLAPDLELSIETHPSLRAFFFESLRRALRQTATIVQPQTEWYLVEVLAEHADHAVPPDQPYALLMARTVDLPPVERIRALCQLGDATLLGLGLFPEAYAKPQVSRDYYVGMGSAAYSNASRLLFTQGDRNDLACALDEISSRFVRFVSTLGVLGQQSLPALPGRTSSRLWD